MKQLLVIFAIISICLFTYGQRININDTIISCGSVCGISIGDQFRNIIGNNPEFQFIKDSVGKYGIDGDGEGILVKYKDEKLFFLWSKEDTILSVGGMVILSRRIITSKGISIGSKLFDCVVNYKDFYLKRSFMNYWLEYYLIKETDCSNNEYFYMIEFYNDNGKDVGIYKSSSDEEERTKSFKTYRKLVDCIEIYK